MGNLMTTPTDTITLEDILAIEGIQRNLLRYINTKSLHLIRLNTDLTRYAKREMGRRALHVTEADVAAGTHVKKLRRFITKACQGRTIYLASGMYMLGDESVPGHAKETIVYDTNGEENGGEGEGMHEYDSDSYWNPWKKRYGPITFTKPGVKLIGPPPSEEPAVFFFNATDGWSKDSVAFHVNTKGIVFENISIQGPCEAIDVSWQQYDDMDYYEHPYCMPCSVLIKHCRIQGCVFIHAGEATIRDCVFHDHTALANKAAISVDKDAVAYLERTSIADSHDRHPTVPSRLSQVMEKVGGLWIDGRAVLTDVTITGNWPAGIVFGHSAYKKDPTTKLIVAGSVTVADNRGEVQADNPILCVYSDRGIHNGNVCLPKNSFHRIIESDGTDEGQAGLEELLKVVREQDE